MSQGNSSLLRAKLLECKLQKARIEVECRWQTPVINQEGNKYIGKYQR